MQWQNLLNLQVVDVIEFPSTNQYTTTQLDSCIAVNMDDYPDGCQGILIYNGSNDQDTTASICQMSILGGADVTGAVVNLDKMVWPAFDIKESSRFDMPSGLNAFTYRLRDNNCVSAKVQLLIVAPE